MDTGRKWIGMTMVAALILGVGIGVFLDRLVLLPSVSSRTDVAARERDDDRHDRRWSRFRERLHRELDLSAEQQDRLDEVLEANHEKAERFWEDSRAQYEALRMTFRQDIRELLTEEQKTRFDRMLEEYDRKRKDRERRDDR